MSEMLLPEGYRRNPNLHAYLYVSGSVSSRHECAMLIATSMLCRNRKEDGSFCGECDCCIKMKAKSHPDCIFVSGDEKTSVDDVRKIEDEAYLSSNEADSKVFILEDADEYNVQSQNALLKIIEEPPKGVRFVLTASSVGAILPTVRSRVCTLSGKTKSIESLFAEIKKLKPSIDGDKAERLAYFCEGFDKADIKSLDEDAVLDFVNKAHLFLSGKDANILLTLPKKREELMLCLQVFMLSCRQIAYVKATGRMEKGILSDTLLAESNAKTSMKRAHALYDVFEEGYLLAEGYANVNAVLCFLRENAR